MMNGGYLMVSKTDTNLYEKLNNALTLGKPVLFYEDENTCYYIDSITKSGTDIILTKGGKTITINDANAVSSVGEIQEKLHKYSIYMLLNTSADGTGDNISLYFQYTTNKKLPLYTNEPLTEEMANSIIDNYDGIIAYDNDSETIQAFGSTTFNDNNMTIYPISEGFIVNISVITIKQIF